MGQKVTRIYGTTDYKNYESYLLRHMYEYIITILQETYKQTWAKRRMDASHGGKALLSTNCRKVNDERGTSKWKTLEVFEYHDRVRAKNWVASSYTYHTNSDKYSVDFFFLESLQKSIVNIDRIKGLTFLLRPRFPVNSILCLCTVTIRWSYSNFLIEIFILQIVFIMIINILIHPYS